jgi:hypothetical protein
VKPVSPSANLNCPESNTPRPRVKMRRTRIEHILCALPQLATEERTFGNGSSVPQAAVSNPQQNSRVSYVAPLSEDIDLK